MLLFPIRPFVSCCSQDFKQKGPGPIKVGRNTPESHPSLAHLSLMTLLEEVGRRRRPVHLAPRARRAPTEGCLPCQLGRQGACPERLPWGTGGFCQRRWPGAQTSLLKHPHAQKRTRSQAAPPAGPSRGRAEPERAHWLSAPAQRQVTYQGFACLSDFSRIKTHRERISMLGINWLH